MLKLSLSAAARRRRITSSVDKYFKSRWAVLPASGITSLSHPL
ncbi:MAG: hypothetical protein AAF693_18915 [Bacteroidota bacterium]